MTTCVHHWLLDEPQPGKNSVAGTCRNCHATHSWAAYEPSPYDRYREVIISSRTVRRRLHELEEVEA